MRVIRVFPRKTRATPNDDLVVINRPPRFWDEADEIHISVTFTWDLKRADELYEQWKNVAPTTLGGPAIGEPGGEFIPGMYLKHGYTITSRGCPNRCWFCLVPKREGSLRELPIREGWNVLDDNLLACTQGHVWEVFQMLFRMKDQHHQIEFTGGLEAAKLKSWHVEVLSQLKPKQLFFAYDTPDDYEPLVEAGKLLREYFPIETFHVCRCFVLIGYPNDTTAKAETRLRQVYQVGFLPMAMLYRAEDNKIPLLEWRRFQRQWARPAIIASKLTHARKYERELADFENNEILLDEVYVRAHRQKRMW